MTDTLWGYDLVVVDKAGAVIGFVPCVSDGDDEKIALTRLQLRHPHVNGLPAGASIAGVRPHLEHFAHLFGRGAPFAIEGWQPLAGPAVPVAAAREALSHTVQVVPKPVGQADKFIVS